MSLSWMWSLVYSASGGASWDGLGEGKEKIEERDGEVGGLVWEESGRELGSDIEEGRGLKTASEPEVGESSTREILVVASGFGHELDERAEMGVLVVGLLGEAIRRIGLMEAVSEAGGWRGEVGAASSNLGVELRS